MYLGHKNPELRNVLIQPIDYPLENRAKTLENRAKTPENWAKTPRNWANPSSLLGFLLDAQFEIVNVNDM